MDDAITEWVTKKSGTAEFSEGIVKAIRKGLENYNSLTGDRCSLRVIADRLFIVDGQGKQLEEVDIEQFQQH